MRKRTKKKLIIILYVLLVLVPFLYTFAFILNNRPSQIELDFEAELSDIFDIPVEAGKLLVQGPRRYEIRGLEFRSEPRAKPFLVAKEATFLSEGEPTRYAFQLKSCTVDLTKREEFKVIFGSLERIIKKQEAGRFPDLEIRFVNSDISFAVRDHVISADSASGEFSLLKGQEGTLAFSGASRGASPSVTVKGMFGWDRRILEIQSAELPFPAGGFVKKIFGSESAVPEILDGQITYEVSPERSVFRISGATKIDAARYLTEKFIGKAKGMMQLTINSWELRQDEDDFDVILEHKSTRESSLILSDNSCKKIAYLLSGEVPQNIYEIEIPEEVGLQIRKQGRDIQFKGSLDFRSTWLNLSDPERSFSVETSPTVDALRQRFRDMKEHGLPEREPPNPWQQLKEFIYGD